MTLISRSEGAASYSWSRSAKLLMKFHELTADYITYWKAVCQELELHEWRKEQY
jgi:hypothetical protein